MTPMRGAPENRFEVRVSNEGAGWEVAILDPAGTPVSVKPCRDGAEARTYASTVRQHLYWLSPDTFRAYYRIGS
jgi:hypothetical protein